MRVFLLSLVLACFLLGCSAQREGYKTYPVHPKIGIIAVDVHGFQYRLVSLEKKVSNGVYQSELWERFSPLETNHWYSPTLSSKNDTNAPLMFNSLER